ncbi:ATP-binding protein [Streptomyces griseus]|uniref:ATP-binding protein n=1 Tax=Streptomyces griseus TaxID=1911 RepID=UPI00055CC745|nr:ATP-binding protein [Streptomyces griseus]
MPAERDPTEREAGLLNTLSVERTWHFGGELSDVAQARDDAAAFLQNLERLQAPHAPDAPDDVLLVVTELASNAFTFAPGPFTLRLRAVADTVQIAVEDTNPTPPEPRRFDLDGRGGIGWHLINALAEQTITEPGEQGKTVHVFVRW